MGLKYSDCPVFDCLYQNIRFLGNGGPSKLGVFSVMKCFGLIDVNRTVYLIDLSGMFSKF